MADYLQHARRHVPGGSDPLPGYAGAAAWAYLLGSELSVDGSNNTTIPSGHAGVPLWTKFITSGDLGVFATHNATDYPGYPFSPVPGVSSFNNSSGDFWVFAVKTGILIGCFDITFASADGSSFPIEIVRLAGNSTFQGEPIGPQAWYTPGAGASVTFSWMWTQPINNDLTDYGITPGDNFYYQTEIQVRNHDSSSHTIYSPTNFQLTYAWIPVEYGSMNHVY